MKDRIQKLEKELAKLKAELDTPEFKVGDWVISEKNSINHIGKITNIIGGKYYYSGLNSRGKWEQADWYYFNDVLPRKATKEEIEQALIKEAGRRGYKVGNYKCLSDGKIWDYLPYGWGYRHKEDELFLDAGVVYKNGKWAEIVEKFFDWDVEYKGDLVKIAPDCKDGFSFSKHNLKVVRKSLRQLDQELTIEELLFELKKLDL